MYSSIYLITADELLEGFAHQIGYVPKVGPILHVPPGSIFEGEFIKCYHDGTSLLNWNELAKKESDIALYCTPHEYLGERSALDLDPTLFACYSNVQSETTTSPNLG